MAAGMAPRVLPLPRQQSFGPPPVPNPFVHLGRFRASDMLRVPVISDSIIPCKGQSAMGVGSGLPGLFARIAGTGYAVTADMSVLQGIILIPLRAICLIFLLLLAWLFASIVTFCQPGRGSVPLKGWRRRMIQVTLSGLTRTAFFVLGFQVKVKGKVASLQEAPIFVAAPHSSFFDAIICALTGMPSIVSRAENLSTPVFGTILSSLQPVAVSRQDSDSRKKTVTEITKRALSRGQWPQILIFPEGTCTNRSCLITFKQGAFVSRVPVQPVLLRYPNKLDTVTWTWQGYSFKVLCLLTMCQLITRVEVEFLPVHVPTEEEKNDPILFAYKVRQTMATALNVPVTDHTFEDCRLMISAGQLTLPMEAGLVEFTKISKKLNLKWNHVREQLNSFAAIASASKGGRIGIEEFADYLKLPITDVLKQLFGLFDRGDKDLSVDALLTIPEASVTRAYHRIPLLGIRHVLQCKQHIVLQVLTNRRFSLIVGAYGVASLFPIKNEDGTIDFREYVIGLSILCNPANTKETIDMAFRLFDMDDDGTITEHEFASIIQSALGVPDLDVSMLFREIDSNGTGKVSYDDFKTFAQKHPEYAKLFTTYLDLQRQQADISDEQDMEPPKVKHSPVRSTAPVSEITPIARNKVCPESNGEDSSSTSDKKDD